MGGPSYEKKMENLKNAAKELEDYMSEDERDGDEIAETAEKEQFTHNFENCVVVDNIPLVNSAKFDKLNKVLKTVFSRAGKVVALDMPYSVENPAMTAGIAFVEYETEAEAQKAVASINNFALDKKHTFLVSKYDDIDKYANADAEYVQPEKPKFVENPNLKNWLTDSAGRDMFVLRHGRETVLYWSDHGEPELEYAGDREKENGKQWCSQYVMWSPMGTYLATFHPQGIALWGGDSYDKVARFAHKHVNIAVFSPQENYLITCNNIEGDNAIIVWDVVTGKLIRSFPSGTPTGKNANGELVQGLNTPFKWSADDRFVARRGKDSISVYELPSMKLLEKKSLRADNIYDFHWSPSTSTLAYWAPENANTPARVSLVELPSRSEIRQKNLFNVSDCKLHWHPSGNFLSVKVTRHSKSKKTLYTNFEIFRTNETLVPVEMLEMKEAIIAFAWEPKGSRFAVIHGDNSQRFNVSFYDCNAGKNNNEVQLLYTLKDKACNQLYWSPHGNNIVLAGMGDMNGVLEFWDVDENQSVSIQEHFKCSHLEWDPSGRVVATSVCQPIDNFNAKYAMDNGYSLWTFQGKLLEEKTMDQFYQFLWRPRPKSLLSDDEYKKVVKNLKKYEKKFNDLDKKKEKERIANEKAEKKRLLDDFRALLRVRRRVVAERKEEVLQLLNGFDSENEDEYIVQTSIDDVIVSQTEDIVRKL